MHKAMVRKTLEFHLPHTTHTSSTIKYRISRGQIILNGKKYSIWIKKFHFNSELKTVCGVGVFDEPISGIENIVCFLLGFS